MGEGTHLYGDRAPHNLQYVVLVASANLTQERVLTGTANQITITDGGAGAAVTLSIPADFIIPTTITIPNTGLHVLDTGGDHDLIIAPGTDLSADRQLTLTTGDAARTITLSGNPTLDDWFDQSVKIAASPTFADVFVPDGGTFGISGNELLTFNAAGTAVFSGCTVGIGAWTEGTLHVHTATAGAVAASGNADELILENSAISGLSMLFPDNLSGRIYWGTTADNDYHRIVGYGSTHASVAGHFNIRVAGADAWRIIPTVAIRSEFPLQIKESAAASADTAAYGQLWVKNDAPCAWRYTDDAGNEVISISNSLLQHSGAIASATLDLSAAGPTDNLDVSGVNTVFVDTSGNNVTLGGTVGGVDGQILCVLVHDATNNFTIEHNEGTGNQDFILHAGADEVMTAEYGGWVFVNDGGDHWHDASHAKHV